MATSSAPEYFCPMKKPRLVKASVESKSSAAARPRCLKLFDVNDDNCLRQYISYYYQFQRSQGFDIDWDKLEYSFDTMPIIEQLRRNHYKSIEEIVRDIACRAISQHNADKGTRIVYMDHVSANFMECNGGMYWITFRAIDLASSCPEPKIYQIQCRRCGGVLCEILILRVKPTHEEIAAVKVDPPPPLNVESPGLPTILFSVRGPGFGFIPDVVFTRIPDEFVEYLSHIYSSLLVT
ncbi:unnamed protein product [Cochlearia groenlandica]